MNIDYERFKKMNSRELANVFTLGFVNKNLEEAFRLLLSGDGLENFICNIATYRLPYCYLYCNLKNVSETEDIWIVLCDLYHNCDDDDIKGHCGVIIYKIIFIMLENDLYTGKYKEKLNAIKCYFKGPKNFKGNCASRFLCGKDVIYLHYLINLNTSIKIILFRLQDSFLRDIFVEFIEKTGFYFMNKRKTIRDYFLQNAEILFNEFIEQITQISDIDYNFFRSVELKLCNEENAVDLVGIWRKFFMFLLNHPSGEGRYIFKDEDPISIQVLIYKSYPKLICEGYECVFYNPMDKVPIADRWIFSITSNQSRTIAGSISMCQRIDFMEVVSKKYRNIIKEYFWTVDLSIDTKRNRLSFFVELMNKLSDIKLILKTSEDYITKEEVVWVYKYIKENNKNKQYILFNEFKRILDFAVQNGWVKVEEHALTGLYVNKVESPNKAKAIPDEHIEKLNEYMLEKSSESLEKFYCYVIFHLLYQSEFRIEQICKLKIGCISHNEREHNLVSISKTSNGEYYEATVTDFFKKLIFDVENVSADLRKECYHKEYNKYLFLYKNERREFVFITKGRFRTYLKNCCKELGLSIYQYGNIRDTHMSKAHEYRLRENISDAFMKVLTGHKSIDITVNHYIEDNLRERILFMSDKIIGDVGLDGVIVDSLPDDLKSKKHCVERGCGVCSLQHCEDDVFYNCFVCKYFITTVDMLHRFEERKQELEILLAENVNSEDIRLRLDLVNQWISAIRKKKEGENGNI